MDRDRIVEDGAFLCRVWFNVGLCCCIQCIVCMVLRTGRKMLITSILYWFLNSVLIDFDFPNHFIPSLHRHHSGR